jgi:predicted nucleic acid-binding Zn ribbon protein
MKCPNCGKEIANDSVFCEYCGTKVETSMPSATRLNWLKWLGLICIAVGIVLALRFMLYAGWFEGLFWYLNSLSAWSENVLPVIATIAVGGYSAYKVFDKKMSFTDKKAMFKRLFIWSSIIFAALWSLMLIDNVDFFDSLNFFLAFFRYWGYGVVYIGVVCLNIWLAKQIVE